jgi:phenylacetate-CoA ligase
VTARVADVQAARGEPHAHAVESIPGPELRSLQSRLLAEQLAYLYERSPFYRRKLEEAGRPDRTFRGLDGMASLPFTVKDEIRQSLEREAPLGEHLAADPGQLVQFHCSSGTTGRASYVALTGSDRDDWNEVQRRCLWSAGVRPQDRVLQAFGMSRGWVGGLPIVQGLDALGASVIAAGAECGTAWLLRVIRDLRPNVLTCTPNFAVYLGEQAEEVLGVPARELSIRKIAVGGEPGGGIPSFRTRADELWDAEMREMMGGGDICPVLWADCAERDGMHFMAHDSVLFEIVSLEDQTPLPVEEGVVGELVYTHLRRRATPLLRFRHADVVTVVGTRCSCGRTTPKIRCFGRTDDMFIVKGVNVHPTAVQDLVVAMRPETTGAVVIVKDSPAYAVPGPLHVRVERGEATPPERSGELAGRIEATIHDLLRCRARVEILEPGTLPRPGREKVSLIEKRY